MYDYNYRLHVQIKGMYRSTGNNKHVVKKLLLFITFIVND